MKIHRNHYALIFGVASLIFTSSCAEVHFEGPVQANAPEVRTAPSFLKGQYEVIYNSLGSDYGNPFQLSVRFEPDGKDRLLASMEAVIPVDGLKTLEGRLAQMQDEGKISRYFVSSGLVYYIIPGEEGDDESQGRVIRLERQGKYLRSDDWAQLTYLFDFANGVVLSFEEGEWMETPDPLTYRSSGAAMQKPLVAKATSQEAWFSMEESKGRWSLFYIRKASGKELQVKFSAQFDEGYFKQNRERLEGILPWRTEEDSDDYLLNPTDAQLRKLLEEPGLFGEMKLRRIK